MVRQLKKFSYNECQSNELFFLKMIMDDFRLMSQLRVYFFKIITSSLSCEPIMHKAKTFVYAFNVSSFYFSSDMLIRKSLIFLLIASFELRKHFSLKICPRKRVPEKDF